jgi:hypothetical protein
MNTHVYLLEVEAINDAFKEQIKDAIYEFMVNRRAGAPGAIASLESDRQLCRVCRKIALEQLNSPLS